MADVSIQQALNQAHHELMATDDRVVLIGEDLTPGVFGVSEGLEERFGSERVINTPISETAFVGMAVGAAMTGLKPIVEIMFNDFMGVCFDQLMNQAAKIPFLSGGNIRLPLVIRTTIGAGDHSGAMHSQSLYGLLMQIPGFMLACPSTPADAAGVLRSAIAATTPTIIFEHKGLYGATGSLPSVLEAKAFGKATIVCEGSDLTIVAVSKMAREALRASDELVTLGINAEVIDPVTIVPLDYQAIEQSVRKTGRLLVVDEGTALGGFADHVIAHVSQTCFDAFKSASQEVTPYHTPVPYGFDQEAKWLPDRQDIVAAARALMGNE